jgi:hypothetical protein
MNGGDSRNSRDASLIRGISFRLVVPAGFARDRLAARKYPAFLFVPVVTWLSNAFIP